MIFLKDSLVLLVMKLIRLILLVSICLFILALGLAFTRGDFGGEASLIYQMIWGKIMLLDLYVGFVCFSVFIFFIEKNWKKVFLWALPLMVLGNVVALVYLLVNQNKILKVRRG